MRKRPSPAVITAKQEKSYIIRDITEKMNFSFHEEVIESQKIVKFHFSLSSVDVMRLVQMIPKDVYAFAGLLAVDPSEPFTNEPFN